MPNASFNQTSFLGGEWSPHAQGSTEDPRYKSALKVCLNAIPGEEGAWSRRPGFQHICTTRNGNPGRLMKFIISQNQSYRLEFTDLHVRFLYGSQLVTETPVAVTSVSTATPALLTTALAQTWVDGDQLTFSYSDLSSAKVAPAFANRQFSILMLSTTTFTLFNSMTGAPIKGADLGFVAGVNLKVARIIDLPTPYVNSEWATLRSVQNELVNLLLQTNNYPQTVIATPNSSGPPTFSINPANFLDGPYFDPVPGSLVTPSALTGTVGLVLSFAAYNATKAYTRGNFVTSSSISYRSLVDVNLNNTPATNPTFWEVVVAGAAFGDAGAQPSDIGRLVRLFSEPPAWVTGTTYSVGNIVTYGGVYWTALKAMTGATPAAGSSNPNQPGLATDTWAINPTAARWTWGKIVGFESAALIAASAGTRIGNMTSKGGLAAAFDGNLFQIGGDQSQCATGVGSNSPGAYIGKDFTGATKVISYAVVYPSTNEGFIKDALGVTQIHLRLYASQTLPTQGDNGTLLGTVNITGDTLVPVTIQSSDTTTSWKYIWVSCTVGPTAPLSVITYIAELQFYNAASSGTSLSVQLLGDPLLYTTVISVWRLGVYSNSTSYPTCGCYHEGRIWLGGAVDNRFDTTVSEGVIGNNFNFAPTEPDGTVVGKNGISYILNSNEKNTIYWMKPDLQGIILGSLGGEWLISSGGTVDAAITADNIKARRITKYGCAFVEPVYTGLTTVFVQRYQKKLLEYLSDAFSGKFYGPNLTKYAKHLTSNNLQEIDYQEEIDPIVWSRDGAGTLKGLTYKRVSMFSSSDPIFWGWHNHSLGSGRLVESICATPTQDGTLDNLAIVTNDPATGFRHIEVMRNLTEGNEINTLSWFLDDAIVPSAAATISVSGNPGLRFYGLYHLNGKIVTAWIGGLDCGDYLVSDGSIDILFGAADGLFTDAYLANLTTSGQSFGDLTVSIDAGMRTIPAVIGFTYPSRGQLLRPGEAKEAGSVSGPPFGKKRRLHQYAVLLNNTQGLSVGTSFDTLKPARLVDVDDETPLPITSLFSGITWDTMDDESSFDGQLAWEVTRPYPATVVSIGGFLGTQDK